MTMLLMPPPWTERAACAEVGDYLFYPGTGESTAPARRVCGDCPVRAACLEDALETGDYIAVRGGLSGDERRLLGVPVTRPPLTLCDSGRHFARGNRRGCDGCAAEAERDRSRDRARDQAGRSAARRARRPQRPVVRTKGIAA